MAFSCGHGLLINWCGYTSEVIGLSAQPVTWWNVARLQWMLPWHYHGNDNVHSEQKGYLLVHTTGCLIIIHITHNWLINIPTHNQLSCPYFMDGFTTRWEPLVAKVLRIVKVSGNMFLQISLCQLFSKESSLFLSRPLSSCAAALSVLFRQLLFIHIMHMLPTGSSPNHHLTLCDSVGKYIVENEGIL